MFGIYQFGNQFGTVDDFGNFVPCADYFDYVALVSHSLATGFAV